MRRVGFIVPCACVFAVVVAAQVGSGAAAGDAPRRSVTYPTHTMGTYANIVLVTADSIADAPRARLAQMELWRLDSLMSNWTTTSEVARINRVAGHEATAIDSEVATVVDSSLELFRESEGTFDITVEPLMRAWGFLGGHRHVPTDDEARAAFRHVGARRVHFDRARRTIRFDDDSVRIDLGGIAKGYAVDVAARALAAAGVRDALVDLTGNMFAMGAPAGSDHWTIGIRDPRDRMPYFARIELGSGDAISTSGKYEQFVAEGGRTYGHIMDPRTGRPAEGLISVTLVSRSAFLCDAWDTPLFVLGPRAARALAARHTDFSAVLVEPGEGGIDTVWVERSLRDRFTLVSGARALFRVAYF